MALPRPFAGLTGIVTVAVLFNILLAGGCTSAPSVYPDAELSEPPLASQAETGDVRAVQWPSDGRDIRVMSFNLRVRTIFDGLNHWDFRKGLLVQTIRRFNPDLLGTQECLAGQADYLREQLSDYSFIGAGRNDGRRRGEMCGIFYKTAKFEQIDHGFFWLSDRPAKPGSKAWGSVFPRLVTWAKLRPTDGGEPICLFNTHFDAFASRARLQSAKLLRLRMENIAGRLPVIVTGDFNADEGTDAHKVLLAGTRSVGRLTDTFLAANDGKMRNDGTRHGFRGGRGGPRIDWIITNNDFHTVDADINHTRAGLRYPSDHFPVTAVLRPVERIPVARIE